MPVLGAPIRVLGGVGLALVLGCASFAGPSRMPAILEPDPPRFVSADAAATAAYLRGCLFGLEGRWPEAFEAFSMAASVRPDDAAIQRGLARAAQRVGRPEIAAHSAERALELAPDDTEVLREGIAALVAVGQLERAADLLENRVEDLENDPNTTLGLLSVYLQLGRLEQAEGLARRLIDRDPADVPGYLALGSVLERTNRLEEAETLYRRAFDRVPLDPRLYDGLARVAQQRGDVEGEVAALREKLALVPGEPYTLRRLIEIHRTRNDRGALIATFEELVHYDPTNVWGRFQLGLHYLEVGRTDEAIAQLAHVADSSDDDDAGSRARYMLGRLYARSGNLDLAIETLDSISDETSTFADAQLALVSIFQGERRYSEALGAMERLLERTDRVDFQVQRAQLLQLTGRLEDAVEVVERLIEDNPEQAGDLYYQLGMLYTSAGLEERALEVMLGALEIADDNPNVLNFVGYVWADRGVRLDEAERMIRRAVEQRPSDGMIVDSLGWVLYKQGLERRRDGRADEATRLFEGAIRELERAQELLDPDDATIERHLADVYRTVARYADALRAYERALGLGPEEEDAGEIRREIERLQEQLGPQDPPGASD